MAQQEEGLVVRFLGDETPLEKASQSAAQSLDKVGKASETVSGALAKQTVVTKQVSAAAEVLAKASDVAGGSLAKIVTENGQISKSLSTLESQLRRFKQGLTSATSTESFARLQRAIAETERRISAVKLIGFDPSNINSTNEALKKVNNASTQVGMNFSRIAQDAPYGFLGIANNLNPALESLQRLQVEAKAAGVSLSSALGSALIGPAGIGLALGIVSSLLVKFGGDLFNSKEEANALAAELKRLGNEADIAAGHVSDLKENLQFGNELGSLNIKIAGGGDADLVKAETGRIEQAIDKLLVIRKQLNETSEQLNQRIVLAPVGSEESKLAEENLAKISEQINKNFREEAELRGQIVVIDAQARLKMKEAAEKAAKDQEKRDKESRKKFEAELRARQEAWAKFMAYMKDQQLNVDFGFVPSTERFSRSGGLLDAEKSLFERNNGSNDQGFINPDLKEVLLSKYERIFKSIGRELPKRVRISTGQLIDVDQLNNLPELENSLKNVLAGINSELAVTADLVSSVLVPSFQGLFDAILAGESPLQAFFKTLGQSVQQLISQLVAAAVQALIISAIMPGATFGGQFGKLLGFNPTGMATGGIVPPGYPGDTFPARLSSGEAVIPLNKLHQYASAGGGGDILPRFSLSGDVLDLWYERTQRKKRRTK